MKAITICQPYAQLIARGEKRIENRTWPTKYRGLIAIHAGKSREWLEFNDESRFYCSGDKLIFGAVLATAQLIDCLMLADAATKHPWTRGYKHAQGPWCWILDEIQRLASPIPWKGAQGLWNFPDDTFAPGREYLEIPAFLRRERD